MKRFVLADRFRFGRRYAVDGGVRFWWGRAKITFCCIMHDSVSKPGNMAPTAFRRLRNLVVARRDATDLSSSSNGRANSAACFVDAVYELGPIAGPG